MFQVHIEDDFMSNRLKLYLADSAGDRRVLYTRDDEGRDVLKMLEYNVSVAPQRPTLEIPKDAAPALLAALARQLGAVEHPQQLRRDYEAERARVDKFIAHLTNGNHMPLTGMAT